MSHQAGFVIDKGSTKAAVIVQGWYRISPTVESSVSFKGGKGSEIPENTHTQIRTQNPFYFYKWSKNVVKRIMLRSQN